MFRVVTVFCFLVAGSSFAQETSWPKPGEYVKVNLNDSRTLQGIVTSETTSEMLSLSQNPPRPDDRKRNPQIQDRQDRKAKSA